MTPRSELDFDHEFEIAADQGAAADFGQVGMVMRGFAPNHGLIWVGTVEWAGQGDSIVVVTWVVAGAFVGKKPIVTGQRVHVVWG